MCSACKAAVATMTASGATEDEAIRWLWEHTAFPLVPPTDEQVAELVAAAETRTT